AGKLQRPVEREGVGGPAAVALGGDDRDVAEGAHRLGEGGESGRVVAVVVREQDAHAGRKLYVTKRRHPPTGGGLESRLRSHPSRPCPLGSPAVSPSPPSPRSPCPPAPPGSISPASTPRSIPA